MKNLVCLFLCLSLAGFTIARATDPGRELIATVSESLSDEEISAEESYVEDESFDMSEAEKEEVAAEEETDEAVASDEERMEDASDNEGEDMGDDGGGADEGD